MSSLFVIVFLAALVGVFKPYIKGVKRWHFGLGTVVAFIMVGVFADPSTTTDVKSQQLASADKPADGKAEEKRLAAKKEPESNWQYYNDKDEMRGTESRYAELEGSNTINLDFPYGEQRGRMVVRQSAQFGFDILVGVESGQIMCNSFSRSHINVKFDDGPIQRYGCNEASDGTSNMVFVEGAKGFLGKLTKSKKVIVEAEFFQNGMQQLAFDTANLKWEN
ncbi:MAG: hypothetical protein U1D66_06470 [Erythrobacter sp.]|nr:hypothetical protein [Erythrobacter sp.]